MGRTVAIGLFVLLAAMRASWACLPETSAVESTPTVLLKASSVPTLRLSFAERTLQHPTFELLESRNDGDLFILLTHELRDGRRDVSF